MKSLYKFLFLGYEEKKLLCQSLFLLCAIRVSLSLFQFQRLNKILSCESLEDFKRQSSDWLVIKEVIRSVRQCSHYVPYATCLTQAMTARTLLGLRGQSSELKIGVTKNATGKLEAHAWIEVDGQIVIGKLLHHQRFAVLRSPV